MPTVAYESWNPGPEQQSIVAQARQICAQYAAQGYDLTLRQLYYQFVSRAIIPNTERSYKNLGNTINNARLAGYLDWDYINDRTRNLESLGHWLNPGDMISTVANVFRIDHWIEQPTRVEIWVEKEALAGVIERVAGRNDVSWFSCRGYVSQSEIWGAAQRLGEYIRSGQNVIILHLGDHDPSGIDMTRDITDRLRKYIAVDWAGDYDIDIDDSLDGMSEACLPEIPGLGYYPEALEVRRIALNMAQIQQYNPPPNPAKLSDARAAGYIAKYGSQSWELDALSPAVLDQLIQDEIDGIVDASAMTTSVGVTVDGRAKLQELSDRWDAAETKWTDLIDLLDQP